MSLFDLLNPFWSEHLLLQSPYRPADCRQLLQELSPIPLTGPARVRMKRNGEVGVQLRGRGNSGWKPRATLIIADAAAGGSELRIRLDRSPGVKLLWVLWPLACISFVLTDIRHAPAHPLPFLESLMVAVIFAEFPAFLTALVWDREPAKLMDLIIQQLRARTSGIPGGP